MKKFVKILIIELIILVVLWIIVFGIDYYRCSNLKEPIFVCEKMIRPIGYEFLDEDVYGQRDFDCKCLGYRVEYSVQYRKTRNTSYLC